MQLVLPNAIFVLARNESRSLLLSSNKWQRDKVFEILKKLVTVSEPGAAAASGARGPLLSHHSNLAATAKSLFSFEKGEDIVCNELGTLLPAGESGHFICTPQRVCFWSHQSNAVWELKWDRVAAVTAHGEKTTIELKDGRRLESTFVGSIVAMQLSNIVVGALAKEAESYVHVDSPAKVSEIESDIFFGG